MNKGWSEENKTESLSETATTFLKNTETNQFLVKAGHFFPVFPMILLLPMSQGKAPPFFNGNDCQVKYRFKGLAIPFSR